MRNKKKLLIALIVICIMASCSDNDKEVTESWLSSPIGEMPVWELLGILLIFKLL